MLSVPLDHGDPEGTQIQLALSMIRHTVPDEEYQGVMLVNPGGPGGSGLGFSLAATAFRPRVAGAYDWIGFDPRGVGSSIPALSCNPRFFRLNRPPYVPSSPEVVDRRLDRAARYADACGEAAPELLPHMTTADVAMDLEAIRVALSVEQINYIGFSYGTYLGQVYATLFPDRLRRAILDSNVDPALVWYEAFIQEQPVGLDAVADLWFQWLADHHRVYRLGRTAEAVAERYYGVLAALTEQPAGGRIGPAEWTEIFFPAPYSEYDWPLFGRVFSDWVHHPDVDALVEIYRSVVSFGYDNQYAVALAVVCSDVAWPADWETWAADSEATHAVAPFVAWANTWSFAPCLFWPVAPGEPVDVGGDQPILLLGETLEGATPFEWALRVRERFPESVLIAVEGGTSHTNALPSGNPCVREHVDRYLLTGALPERAADDGPDVVCDRLPLPEPHHAAPRLDDLEHRLRMQAA